jgi:hypothetical protein
MKSRDAKTLFYAQFAMIIHQIILDAGRLPKDSGTQLAEQEFPQKIFL